MTLSDEDFRWCVENLGVSIEQLLCLRDNTSSSRRILAEIQRTSKKRFRLLSPEYHPDRTGDDPVKTERFRQLSEVYHQIQEAGLPSCVPSVSPRTKRVRYTIRVRG